MEKIFDVKKRGKNLSLNDVLSRSTAIAKAMTCIHSSIDGFTILHRDLKPDNIGKRITFASDLLITLL